MTNERPRKSKPKWWHYPITILVLAGMFASSYYLIRLVWQGFSGLPKEVAATVVVASATVLISVLSLIISKQWEIKKGIQQAQLDRKIPVYEGFMKFWFEKFLKQKTDAPQNYEKEILKFVTEFTQKLMLWGSDRVLKEYCKFRRLAVHIDPKERPKDIMFLFENLLFAIRRDTGHKNRGFRKGDLLALFLTDVDKLFENTSLQRRV